jgi:hypothetical protein
MSTFACIFFNILGCISPTDLARTDWEVTLDVGGHESIMDSPLSYADCRRELHRWRQANQELFFYCRYPDY